jgi:hypothetical protein
MHSLASLERRASIGGDHRLGVAWILFCCAIAVHVADEALTDFLSVYNPTVTILRQRAPWLPLPAFAFNTWLLGLLSGVILLFLLSKYMFRGSRWIRLVAYVLAILMMANGSLHILGTILGHSVESVRFARPMPGFYSSPFLLAASIYLVLQLRRKPGVEAQVKLV